MSKQLVKVTISFGPYNAGERCSFEKEKAEELLQRNLVCFIDAEGEITKQNAGQKRVDELSAAMRADRTVKDNKRLLETSRRFFIDMSSNERSIQKVQELIKAGDNKGLASYALDLGYLGVTIERIQTVVEERQAEARRESEKRKAERTAKPETPPSKDEKSKEPAGDEKPADEKKKPSRRRSGN